MRTPLRRQNGATLLIGLIMLVLLTLMATTTFKLGRSNLLIVGNMQFRSETVRAAEEALEVAVSKPSSVTAASNTSVDVNADGTPDVAITVTPTLQQASIRLNVNLKLPQDAGCTLGQLQNWGVVGAATGNSLCAGALYDLRIVATEAATSTSVELHQGVKVQIPADSVCAMVTC